MEPINTSDQRAALLQAAEAAGWPAAQLRQAEHVLPGEQGWRRFIEHASDRDVIATLAAWGEPVAIRPPYPLQWSINHV